MLRISLPARRASGTIILSRGVSIGPVEDGLTLIDGRRGTVYHLNPTGAVILGALIDGGTEQAVATITRRYGITEARARSDVTALVEDIRRRRLVIIR